MEIKTSVQFTSHKKKGERLKTNILSFKLKRHCRQFSLPHCRSRFSSSVIRANCSWWAIILNQFFFLFSSICDDSFLLLFKRVCFFNFFFEISFRCFIEFSVIDIVLFIYIFGVKWVIFHLKCSNLCPAKLLVEICHYVLWWIFTVIIFECKYYHTLKHMYTSKLIIIPSLVSIPSDWALSY